MKFVLINVLAILLITSYGNFCYSQKIASGSYSYFKISINIDSTLWAWGNNEFGQLGDGTDTLRLRPKQIDKNKVWKKVYAGIDACYAIKFDGTLWAWGIGQDGVLGQENTTSYSSPKQVGALTDWAVTSSGNPANKY